jgi:hypothetical protein
MLVVVGKREYREEEQMSATEAVKLSNAGARLSAYLARQTSWSRAGCGLLSKTVKSVPDEYLLLFAHLKFDQFIAVVPEYADEPLLVLNDAGLPAQSPNQNSRQQKRRQEGDSQMANDLHTSPHHKTEAARDSAWGRRGHGCAPPSEGN